MDKYKTTQDILNTLSLRVTKGVYPGHKVVSTTISSPVSLASIKKSRLLVIITGCNTDFDDSLKEVKKLREYGYDFDVALSESAEYMFGIDNIKKNLNPINTYTANDRMKYLEMIQESDAVIVPVTTQNTAIKLSLGIQDSFTSMLLWQSLWQGKPLFMNMDDMITHRGMEAKSKMLRQMMSDYVDKLKRLGVKAVSTLKLSKEVHESLNTEKNSSVKLEASSNERPVITEKDIVKQADGRDTVIVPLRAIVTPLAFDAAKNLGIKIVKQNS